MPSDSSHLKSQAPFLLQDCLDHLLLHHRNFIESFIKRDHLDLHFAWTWTRIYAIRLLLKVSRTPRVA